MRIADGVSSIKADASGLELRADTTALGASTRLKAVWPPQARRPMGSLVVAHVVALTNFDTTVPQDGVAGADVEEELRNAVAQ